jgi:hypothetical protein
MPPSFLLVKFFIGNHLRFQAHFHREPDSRTTNKQNRAKDFKKF